MNSLFKWGVKIENIGIVVESGGKNLGANAKWLNRELEGCGLGLTLPYDHGQVTRVLDGGN